MPTSDGRNVSAANAPADVADQFVAKITWMGSEPLLPGRSYLFKIGTRTVPGMVSRIKYRIDVSTPKHVAATTLELNEIGVCNVSLEQEIPFDPDPERQVTRGFIVIDRRTNETCGSGMLDFALRRAHNIHRERFAIDKPTRGALLGQKACVVWLTGLSGAGKTTIANLVESKLHQLGRATYLLDGNNIRHGLNRDLGFTDADRVENIRRISEVAKLMVDAGLIVLVASISPFRSERRLARELMADDEFFEVYVNTPLSLAEQRDPKGLYRKARHGELKNFTGIDSPYEPPEHPELEIYTPKCEPADAADEVIACLRRKGML